MVPLYNFFSQRTDFFQSTASIPFVENSSIQFTALRAVRCKAIIHEFYERCQQRVLGPGSCRCADYSSHCDTGLGDIYCDQVHYLGASVEGKSPDLGWSSLGKTQLHPRTQEESLGFH